MKLEGFTLAPADFLVVTRPVALKPLALRAKAWLAAAALGLALTAFAYPAATAPVFKKIYGTGRGGGGGFFDNLKSAFSRNNAPPPWKVNQGRWQIVFYAGFGLAGLAGVWRSLGPVAAEARAKAAELEAAGKNHITAGDLDAALAAMSQAARWTADPARRSTLGATVTQLRGRVAAQTAGLAPAHASAPDATALLARPAGADVTLPAGAHAADQTMIARPGANLVAGRYELRKLLGRGGMGEVHEAHDTVLDRTVAFKKLPAQLAADVQFVQRFTQEARALAKLSHPNVVQVFDIIRDPQGVYIALEYVPGGDLDGLIRKEGKLDPARAVSLAKQAAEGLAFAHREGIVHRDIKPHNILLTADGRPKLTDFGLAKVSGSAQMTVDGAVMGSPAYMSPEQAEGKTADFRSDVYSFGVMLYHMLAGQPPFQGGTQEVLMQHLTQPVPPVAGAPAPVNALLAKCTARKPDDRYASGAELVQALAALA